jgi:TIR domain
MTASVGYRLLAKRSIPWQRMHTCKQHALLLWEKMMSKYRAFISYKRASYDSKVAHWLHKSIEQYRSPRSATKLLNLPRRIGRVFLDRDELSASSNLGQSINDALHEADFLIVVCSPRTPESRWVAEEITRFQAMGKQDRILFVLIDGEPEESLPGNPSEYGVNNTVPLAADFRNMNLRSRRVELLRLIAPLLGCEFNDLRQREQRRQQNRVMTILTCSLALTLTLSILSVIAVLNRNTALQQRELALGRLAKMYTHRALAEEHHNRTAWNWLAAGAYHDANDQASSEQLVSILVQNSSIPSSVIIHPEYPDRAWVGKGATIGVTSGTNGSLQLWNVQNENPIGNLISLGSKVQSVRISPDERRVLAVSSSTIMLISSQDGGILASMSGTELREYFESYTGRPWSYQQDSFFSHETAMLSPDVAVVATHTLLGGPGFIAVLRANEPNQIFDPQMELLLGVDPMKNDPDRFAVHGTRHRIHTGSSPQALTQSQLDEWTEITYKRDSDFDDNSITHAIFDIENERLDFVHHAMESDQNIAVVDLENKLLIAVSQRASGLVTLQQWPSTPETKLSNLETSSYDVMLCDKHIVFQTSSPEYGNLYSVNKSLDPESLTQLVPEEYEVIDAHVDGDSIITLEQSVDDYTEEWARIRKPNGSIVSERRVTEDASIIVGDQILRTTSNNRPMLFLSNENLSLLASVTPPPVSIDASTSLHDRMYGVAKNHIAIANDGAICVFTGEELTRKQWSVYLHSKLESSAMINDELLLGVQQRPDGTNKFDLVMIDYITGEHHSKTTDPIDSLTNLRYDMRIHNGMIEIRDINSLRLYEIDSLNEVSTPFDHTDFSHPTPKSKFYDPDRSLLLQSSGYDPIHRCTILSWVEIGSKKVVFNTTLNGSVWNVRSDHARSVLVVSEFNEEGDTYIRTLDYQTLELLGTPLSLPQDTDLDDFWINLEDSLAIKSDDKFWIYP